KTLGVPLPNLTNPYYVAMKKSFEDNAAAQGLNVKISIADNDGCLIPRVAASSFWEISNSSRIR
ncbi:hypothetical protein WAJ29_19095, partial [Acinetobacter baumannii]